MKLKRSNHNLGKHVCTLNSDIAEAFKPESYLTSFRRTLEIWKGNPNVKCFYHSLAHIEKERKWLKEAKFRWKLVTILVCIPLSLRFIWEAFQMCILLMGFVVIPLNLIYGPMLRTRIARLGLSHSMEILEIFCDMMYFVDFLLLLITGYPHASKMKVFLTHKLIIRYYTSSNQFFVDLLSVISVTTFLKIYLQLGPLEDNLAWIFYVKLFSLLKFFRLLRFMLYFKNVTRGLHYYYFTLSVIKHTLICIIFLHLLTCIYIMLEQYLIVYSKGVEGETIVPSFRNSILPAEPYTYMYLTGHHIIISNLLSIRRENIYAYFNNTPGVWLFEVCVFGLLATFGFIVSSVLTILIVQMILSLNSSEIKYYAVVNQLTNYMRHRDIPMPMQQRMYSLYNYCFQGSYYREAIIYNNLSESLMYDINIHSSRALIENVPILSELPKEILGEIVTQLKCKFFLNNDVIIRAGAIDQCMYFISTGSVAVTTPSGREICHLQDGAYFGEIALIISGQKRIANVIAIEICEVYQLERSAFLNCFEDSSQFYKKIEQSAHERREKTALLEELHRKYLIDRSTRRRYHGVMNDNVKESGRKKHAFENR